MGTSMGLISIPVHGQPHGQNGVGEKPEGGKNGRKKGEKGKKEKEKIQTPYPAVFTTITEIAEFPTASRAGRAACNQQGRPLKDPFGGESQQEAPPKIPLAL